ncbi:MAG: ATP-grasp domain-containing protein [Candidatus Hodarchaeota archaeon]
MKRKTGAIVVGGHFQGLGVIRSLGRRGIPVCLLDSQIPIARFSRYIRLFKPCPPPTYHKGFLEYLIDLVRCHGLHGWVVIPTDDETVFLLSKNRDTFEQYVRVAVSPWDSIQYTYEKKLTYQRAESLGIAIPKTYYPVDEYEIEKLRTNYPLVIKPSVVKAFYNKTKTKAYLVQNHQEALRKYRFMASVIPREEILIQEFIPGGPRNLYSYCCYLKNGEVLGKVIAKRQRQHPMDFGHASTYAISMNIAELEPISLRFLRSIGFEGIAEVEFMQDPRDGRFKLLEVNPRIWGWHTLAIRSGADLPYILYQDLVGEEPIPSDFRENVKWIRLVTDIPTALSEIMKGKLSIREYMRTFQGEKEFAVLSSKDPGPFLAELFLLPYLRAKRGF